MTHRSLEAWRGNQRNWALFVLAVIGNVGMLYWPDVQATGGVPHLDKLAHVASFALVGWAGVRVGLPIRWLLPALLAHAVVSELVQEALLPARGGDVADVAADVIGVALGLIGGSWSHERAGDGRRAGGAAVGGNSRSR